MQAQLDYPGYTCPQCRQNHATDGVEPACWHGRCPVPGVTGVNALAVQLGRVLFTQAVYDLGLAPFILERCGYKGGSEEWVALVERLSVIHGIRRKHERAHAGGEDEKAGAGQGRGRGM